MLIGASKQQKQEWNKSLHSYEKQKRTKRPFGKESLKIEHKCNLDIFEKEMKFNPVLQSFRDERQASKTIEQEQIQKVNQQIKFMKNNYKYNTDYDIINFNAASVALPPRYKSISISNNHDIRKKQYKDPTYQGFNIINGNYYQKDYLQKVDVKPIKSYNRRIVPKEEHFNIINGSYTNDQREHFYIDESERRQDVLNRSEVMRVYDNINGHYYNPEVEEQFQRDLKKREQNHGRDYQQKMPPSYVHRVGIAQNQVIPLTQKAKQIEDRKEHAKTRYKVRYQVDNQHKLKNEYQTEKKELEAKNRVHNGRLLQQKGKEFNIINSKYYHKNRAEQLYGRSLTQNPYDYSQVIHPFIKHEGFSRREMQLQ